MKSNFEEESKLAAVAAVERRWQDKEAAQRKSKRAASFQRFGAIAALCAIGIVGAAVVLYKLGYGEGVSLPEWTHISFFDKGVDEAGLSHIDSFTDILERFKTPEIKVWRKIPQEIKPKNAKAGAVYYILLEKKNGSYGVYRMTAKGDGAFTVEEFMPLRKPIPIKMSEYKKACEGVLQLIEHAGEVYIRGTSDVAEGQSYRQRLLK